MRFATFAAGGHVHAGVVSEAGLHPLPGGTTVLDLVQTGLPAALEAGQRALEEPAVLLDGARLLLPLDPPTIRDFDLFVDGLAFRIALECGSFPDQLHDA